MIHATDIQFQWENRSTMIVVKGYYLGEEEVKYLIEVLQYLEEHDFYLHDRFINSSTIVKRCLEDLDKMRDGRDVCSVDTAEGLLESNRVIGEYA